MRGRKAKKPSVHLSELRIEEEALKISRDFMKDIPDLLQRLAAENPAKAIDSWATITEFAVSKKGKDGRELPPMNLNINLVPAKRERTIDIEHLEMKPQEISGKGD